MDSSGLAIKRQWLLPNSRGNLNDLYEVGTKEIASGEFGKVFKAKLRGQKTDTWRAIKRIPKKDVTEKAQFMKQVDILAQLDHPNIAKLFETLEDDRFVYLVMELCEGGELFDKIEEEGCLTEQEAREYFWQLMSAVSYLHTHEVAHRDIKPENLLFLSRDKNSPLKLIDFGLSSRFSKMKPSSMKTMVGTAFYMAPEVIKGVYDQRCDLWSAGVILYLMVAGCQPFNGQTDEEIEQLATKMEYTFDLPQLEDMTENCKSLISSMLTDAGKRQPADAVLRHPWVLSRNSNAPVLNVQAMKAFSESDRLRRLVISIMVSQSNEDSLTSSAPNFKLSNYSNTGTLYADELKTALQRQNQKLSADQVIKIVRAIDSSNSGKITFLEFAAANADAALVNNPDLINLAFDILDTDHDSSISESDLNAFLQRRRTDYLGSEFKSDILLIKTLIQEGDSNRDGVIDLKQFTDMMVSSAKA